jgi:hypothetical protein
MRRLLFAVVVVALAGVLGATVFSEPVAWAAQTVGATIVGPLDSDGNVMVSESGSTELIATGRVASGSSLGPFDVSSYKQVRIAVGDLTCGANDAIDVSTREAASSGSGFYRLDLFEFCGNVNTRTLEVPARTLNISCFCGTNSYAEVAIWGRRN